jgi:hypothetical protein
MGRFDYMYMYCHLRVYAWGMGDNSIFSVFSNIWSSVRLKTYLALIEIRTHNISRDRSKYNDISWLLHHLENCRFKLIHCLLKWVRLQDSVASAWGCMKVALNTLILTPFTSALFFSVLVQFIFICLQRLEFLVTIDVSLFSYAYIPKHSLQSPLSNSHLY